MAWRTQIREFALILGGSVGRLAVSLAFFLVAANVLSLGDFGLYATASACGIILARVAAFGFISPLFRAATVRRRLTGTYLAGYLLLFAASLPLVALLAFGAHALIFSAMPLLAFLLVVAAEVVGWRLLETVSTINNGWRAFGRASAVVIVGTAIRTGAALAFWLAGWNSLTAWAWTYFAANMAAAIMAFAFFLPGVRLRLRPALYARRMRDAMAAAAADLTFYLQAELDKAVVLTAAGPRAAGAYAIAMRIIDLTAVPVRAYNQLAMQKVMTDRGHRLGLWGRVGTEAAIAAISTCAIVGVIVLFWIRPDALGRNVQTASALFLPLLAVPALRNLIEYHAELLYGVGRTGVRAGVLALIAILKASMLHAAIATAGAADGWLTSVNWIFLAAYALSAVVAYQFVRRPLRNV
jgi:O-antigen/teichoic acid export membrane protein